LARDVLEEETGLSPGWIENGGLFIASNERRLDEYKRLQTLGKAYGIESHVCTPDEAQKIHPLMSTEDMHGALYSPNDGTIDPSGWVSALTKGAKMRGAKIFENCRVTAVDTAATTSTGKPKVTGVATSQGYIKTNTVVDCAGVWGANLGSLVGVDVPLVGMRHAYIVMDKVSQCTLFLSHTETHRHTRALSHTRTHTLSNTHTPHASHLAPRTSHLAGARDPRPAEHSRPRPLGLP
jgi:sarcosine dehydrogenase